MHSQGTSVLLLDHVYPWLHFLLTIHATTMALALPVSGRMPDLLLLCLHCWVWCWLESLSPTEVLEPRSLVSWGFTGAGQPFASSGAHSWMTVGHLSFPCPPGQLSTLACLLLLALFGGKTKLRKCQMEKLYLSKTPRSGFGCYIYEE